MCAFKLSDPGLPAELWNAFDSDDDSDGPTEDEHHVIFDCPSYMYDREQFQDLFQSHITIVSHFLNQPQCNRLSKFLTWIRALPHEQSLVWWACARPRTDVQSINQSRYLLKWSCSQ